MKLHKPSIATEDDPCFVPFLPVHSVDPDGPVFLLADNAGGLPDSMGMAWRFTPPATEARTDGEVGSLATRLDNFVRNLPDGTIAQFILRSSRDLGPQFGKWEDSTRTDDPVQAELAASRRSAIENLSIVSPSSTFQARRLDVLFTILAPGTWPATEVGPLAAIAAAAGRGAAPEAKVARAYATDKKKLQNLARSLESMLSQAEVRFARLGEEEFVRDVYGALNPARSRILPPPAPCPGEGHCPELLRERVAQSPITVDLDRGFVLLDETYVKFVSVTHLPGATRAGMFMRSARAVTFLDVVPEMDLVLSVHVEDQEKIRDRFGGARRLATDQSKDAHQSPSMRGIVGELCEIEDELGNGARVASVRISAAVRGRALEETEDRARAVHAAFQTEGFRAMIEETLVETLFYQTLPFGYRAENDRTLRRSRRLLTANLAHLLPLYGSFQGTGSPNQLLLNRRGELISFGFFNGKEAPHAIATGKSGAGKSVYGNDAILQGLRTGGRVWILDRGGSYLHLNEMLDGDYISFDAARPKRINPCGKAGPDGICPDERQSFLRDWLTEMATRGKSELPARDQGLLTEAIRKAFQEHPGEEIRLAYVHAALTSLACTYPSALDLALSIADFCGAGPYARFFDGADEVDFKRPLVTLDLADAALEDVVRSPLVMAIIYRIAEAAKSWLAVDKYLVIDEAWTLLQSPAAARFLENVARTARKARLSLVILSQQISDLEGPSGKAILEQASYRIFLYQDTEAIRHAAQLLGLSAREVELYQSLAREGTEYREIFIKTPTSSGVVRLVLDPLAYWLTTTDVKDRAILDECLDKAHGRGLAGREALRSALIAAALRHPRGAPAEGAVAARER